MSKWSMLGNSLLTGLKYNRYASLEDIAKAVEAYQEELVQVHEELRVRWLKVNGCTHTYGEATYTIQRRMTRYFRVNERVCSLCGQFETQTELCEDGSDRPEWALPAYEAFFNNNF